MTFQARDSPKQGSPCWEAQVWNLTPAPAPVAGITSPSGPSLRSRVTSHQIPSTSAKNKLKTSKAHPAGSPVWGHPRATGTHLALSFWAAWALLTRCRQDSCTHHVQPRATHRLRGTTARPPCTQLLQWAMGTEGMCCSRARALAAPASCHIETVVPGASLRPS